MENCGRVLEGFTIIGEIGGGAMYGLGVERLFEVVKGVIRVYSYRLGWDLKIGRLDEELEGTSFGNHCINLTVF